MPGLRHPAGETARLTGSVAADYNAYVTSGRMTNTDPAQAYSTLTPFELGTADYAVLKAWAQPSGAVDRSASVQDNVTCLSCHRAHAGGFDSLLRFSLEAEFMTTVDASGAAMYPIAGTAGGVVEQTLGAGYSARMAQAASSRLDMVSMHRAFTPALKMAAICSA